MWLTAGLAQPGARSMVWKEVECEPNEQWFWAF